MWQLAPLSDRNCCSRNTTSEMSQSSSQRLIGATAVLFTVSTAILLSILAASNLPITQEGHFSLLLASAVVDIILLFPLILLLFKYTSWTARWSLRRSYGWTQRNLLLILAGIVPSIMAGSVVATAVAVISVKGPKVVLGEEMPAFYVASFAVWIVSLAFQAAYFAILGASTNAKSSVPTETLSTAMPSAEMVESSRVPTATVSATDAPDTRSPSSLPSLMYSDGNTSSRSSLSTLQRPGSSRPGSSRPGSSKRGLLRRSHSQPRQSARSSFDTPSRRPSHDEGFDFWDTSGVSDQMREIVMQSKPLSKNVGLPTIPGSRSPSPAKALEGPFFNPSPDDSPPQSPLPQPPISCPISPPSSSPDIPNFSVLFPSAVATPTEAAPASNPPSSQKQRYSRPPTLIFTRGRTSDDHIHPLFRTSSPTPPPSASPNTIVTAAPEAGEMINRHTLQRMRSTSQSNHPSPLQRSESFPDFRETRLPLSPISNNIASPTMSPRAPTRHQRKRSASLEGCIIRD